MAANSPLSPGDALAALRSRPGFEDGCHTGTPGSGRPVWRRVPARAVAISVFVLLAGTFSAWPAFELIGPRQAVISLSFSHAGQRVHPCRQRSQAELEALPPNMRRPTECPRERLPLRVELWLDDALLYRKTIQPTGIWKDGESSVYGRFPVHSGVHRVRIGMADSGRKSGQDYGGASNLSLEPGQHLVIDFDGAEFRFRTE